MDDKLLNLLRIVVEEYVATAEPVASGPLVKRYDLAVSPATIRNWFSELDETGLLMQPHTSGGRVPTEQGFKTYVEHFVKPKPAQKRERDILAKAALIPSEDERRMKQVAKTLAELSGLAVIVALNQADTFYTGLSQLFAQPEFKNWERVVSLTELLDHLDDTLGKLRSHSFAAPQILLGSECPFGVACGSVVATTDGALVGLLGPIRMDYQANLSQLISALEALKN